MIARQSVRQYSCVGRPDVGFRIDIVNRSRNIERLGHDVELLFGGFFFRGRLRRRGIFFVVLDVSSVFLGLLLGWTDGCSLLFACACLPGSFFRFFFLGLPAELFSFDGGGFFTGF